MAIQTPAVQSPGFSMTGARQIVELSGGSVAITEQIEAIEHFVFTNPGIAIDSCRSIIETTCKIILTDRAVKCDSLGFRDLLQRTYEHVDFASASNDGTETLQDQLTLMVSGLETIIGAITELRKAYGTSSHGRNQLHMGLDSSYVAFAANCADSLVTFLYLAHKHFFKEIKVLAPAYHENPEFNEYCDSQFAPYTLFEYSYQASEVLYYVDLKQYLSFLGEFRGQQAGEDKIE